MARLPGIEPAGAYDKPIKFYEVYDKFGDLDGVNSQYRDRWKYGHKDNFYIAQAKAAENLKKLNQGDVIDLLLQDRGLSTMHKIYGGFSIDRPGITIESGTLSELAVHGQKTLSVQTKVISRILQKPQDPNLDKKARSEFKSYIPELEAKQKEILNKDRQTLYQMDLQGQIPDDVLLRRLLDNGFKYWDGGAPNKTLRRRFEKLAEERKAERMRTVMDQAAPRAREQYETMLNMGNNPSAPKKSNQFIKKVLTKVGESVADVALEMLGEKLKSAVGHVNFFAFTTVLPVLGPATEETASSEEEDVYEEIIKEYVKRGLEPPKYEDLKDGAEPLSQIMKTLKEWLLADSTASWNHFQPSITKSEADSSPQEVITRATEDPKPAPSISVDLAEQILMLQVHLLWCDRIPCFDPRQNPWLWEVASDEAQLVSELCNKYLDEGSAAMYSHIGTYSYQGKRPLSRSVACSVANEALESIFAATTGMEAGEGYDDPESAAE